MGDYGNIWLVSRVVQWGHVSVRDGLGFEHPLRPVADGSIGFVVAFSTRDAAVEWAKDGDQVWMVSPLRGETKESTNER